MNKFTLKRQLDVDQKFDLIVAGGGAAGSAAAIAAGRQGVKTLLIENNGCLGGIGTSGLVSTFGTMANGEKMIVGGIMEELVEEMYEKNIISEKINPNRWRKWQDKWVPFNPEGLKKLLEEKVIEAGVEIRYFTKIIDAETNSAKDKVNGVITHNCEGYKYIPSEFFIDATGDAFLSSYCGVKTEKAGRDTENIMPPTLCAIYSGIDWERVEKGENEINPLKQQEKLEKAISDGVFSQKDRHLPGIYIMGKMSALSNSGHIFNTDALNNNSLTEAMISGRKMAKEYTYFYKNYFKGTENIELVSTASILGVRESRKIIGEYKLKYEDYKQLRQFPDQIAVYSNPVDIHIYDCSDQEYQRYKKEFNEVDKLEKGQIFGIPYGVLIPIGWKNLLVAGRAVSTDIKMHGAIRNQPACYMMGEAAGTAAKQALENNQYFNELDTEKLVKKLRKNNAYLPQNKLSKNMTRN